ncbi:MAG: acyltransferase [Bacteroidia bacterium]|nr:acyltransferase [Bacteroidia bacterium]MCF8425925.1 acyltransferase [Bacteroidia bacterium]MCF8447397.1 acyltransferase [Bacteroidia bacterium]
MSIAQTIKSNPTLKKIVHWMLIPSGQARPRFWVKLLVNPFYHKVERGSTIRRNTRMDVLPFNEFSLGAGSTIEDFSTINNGVGAVHIGKNSRVGIGNVLIGPVTIGNNVILAQNIVVSGLNHGYEDVNLPIHKQPVSTQPIVIEDDSWLGANVVVTSGVTIGKHCVVAAGAVVTKSIPPFSIAVGNPARVIKQYDFEEKIWKRVN